MSSKPKGTPSSSSLAEGPPAGSKTKVKEQIKIIVEDLELVLGDLKDVAKELKEVSGAGVGKECGPFCPLGVSVGFSLGTARFLNSQETIVRSLRTDFLCSGDS
ncbi:Proline-rich protein 16 [Myotis davidii]|uniref:Proline-rich protein 16 n=1 Tax=Myotis davidii TaxID=225400 RepID=L5MDV0_MYODS|nr:Proline-rich protein 16 [Myotis davidii]